MKTFFLNQFFNQGFLTWKLESIPHHDGVVHAARGKPHILGGPGQIQNIFNTTTTTSHTFSDDGATVAVTAAAGLKIPTGPWSVKLLPVLFFLLLETISFFSDQKMSVFLWPIPPPPPPPPEFLTSKGQWLSTAVKSNKSHKLQQHRKGSNNIPICL